VDLDRGAVVLDAVIRDLELARQEREFRVQRGVLAEDLRPDARTSISPGATPAHWSEVTLRMLLRRSAWRECRLRRDRPGHPAIPRA